MSVDFNNLVDDDGSNTVGTLLDKAELQALLLGAGVNRTDTGAVNNWAPSLAGHTFITWAGAADVTLSGLAGGLLGQHVVVRNLSTTVMYWLHQSSLSAAGNRLRNAATSGATPVAPGGWIIYRYDGATWQLVGHEQGAWITPAYTAGDYSGNGAMTWTVDAGDVETCRFLLRGSTLAVELAILGSSVGGTPNTLLRRLLPGGFSAAHIMRGTCLANDAGVYAPAQLEISTPTRLDLYRNIAGSGNWAAVTNGLHVLGVQFSVEVL